MRPLAVLSALLLAHPVVAQTFTWDGGLSHNNFTVNDNWSTGNNWVNGAPISAEDTAIVFTRSGQWTTATQNVASPFRLNSLTFDTASNVTTLSGGVLDFRAVPATLLPPVLTQNSPTDVTVNNAISVTGANLTVQGAGGSMLTLAGTVQVTNSVLFKQGSGTLVLSGTNNLTGGIAIGEGVVRLNSAGALGTAGPILFSGSGGSTGTLQYTAANQTDYSGRFLTSGFQPIRVDTNGQNVTFASEITGVGTSLTKLGAGTLTVNGPDSNAFLGPTNVLAGTLVLNKFFLGQTAIGGDLSIGNAVNPGPANSAVVSLSQRDFQTPATCNVTVFSDGRFFLSARTNNINTLTMTGGQVDISLGVLGLGGDVTVNGTAGGSRIVSLSGLNDLNLRGGTRTFSVARGTSVYDLDVPAGVFNGTLVKTGAGVLRLAGGTNDTLSVTLQAGTLALGKDTALGTSGGTFTIAGGTVAADGGNRTATNPVSLAGNATIGASLDGTSRALTFAGPTTLLNNTTLTISNNAPSGLGAVSLGSNTLALAGNGDLTIGGAVTGSGGLTKSGSGRLTLTGNSSFGSGLIVFGGALTAKNGGSLGAAGNVVTLLNGSTLSFADTDVDIRQTLNLGIGTLAPVAGGSITYTAATVNGGVLGAGAHVLGDGARLDAVRVTAGAAVGQAGGTAVLNNVLFTGTSTFTQAAGATLNITGDFTANPQTTITIGGAVNAGGGTLAGGVTVNAGGTLATASAPLFLNTPRGTTVNGGGTLAATAGGTVELGGLLVNNGTHTGVLNVNSGGLAQGAGTFGTVNINSGGRFSPGNGPGTATSGPMTWGAGGTYVWEINDAAGTAGVNSDLIRITGTLTVAAGPTAASRFTLELTGLDATNAPGLPANFDPGQPHQWLILAATDGITGFDPANITLDAGHFAAAGTFALTQSGNVLVLSFTPAPEPRAGLFILAGLAVVGGGRWRYRRPSAE